jgi:glycosyltransferase involved in cell wall biosynthesis
MLSILIPVFNEDIRDLASELNKLIAKESASVEVIFGDDKSDSEDARNSNIEFVKNLDDFRYIERSENLKYCANRNQLAREAKYDSLLFLDADVRIKKEDFLSKWLKYSHESQIVFCGGNDYQENQPMDKKQVLKWVHGKQREETSFKFRKNNPYLRFSSSNFMISKSLFLKVSFDEGSTHYGYNDTVYAYTLKKNEITVTHIDNPVLNLGLMTDDVFLIKTKEAIKNLLFFESRPYIEDDFKDYIKVLRVYYKLQNLGLTWFVRIFLKRIQGILVNGLYRQKPNLRNLDLLKLYYLLEAKRV